MTEDETYILDIQWERRSSDSPILPPLVGPFDTPEDAQRWGELNIANGSWEVRTLVYPYRRALGERLIDPAQS